MAQKAEYTTLNDGRCRFGALFLAKGVLLLYGWLSHRAATVAVSRLPNSIKHDEGWGYTCDSNCLILESNAGGVKIKYLAKYPFHITPAA